MTTTASARPATERTSRPSSAQPIDGDADAGERGVEVGDDRAHARKGSHARLDHLLRVQVGASGREQDAVEAEPVRDPEHRAHVARVLHAVQGEREPAVELAGRQLQPADPADGEHGEGVGKWLARAISGSAISWVFAPLPGRGGVDLLEGVAGRQELGHDLLALHREEAQLLPVPLVAQRPSSWSSARVITA